QSNQERRRHGMVFVGEPDDAADQFGVEQPTEAVTAVALVVNDPPPGQVVPGPALLPPPPTVIDVVEEEGQLLVHQADLARTRPAQENAREGRLLQRGFGPEIDVEGVVASLRPRASRRGEMPSYSPVPGKVRCRRELVVEMLKLPAGVFVSAAHP